METFVHGVCGSRRHTVCGAVKVEFISTMPAVTAPPANQNFNGNVLTPVPGTWRCYFIVPCESRDGRHPIRITGQNYGKFGIQDGE